MKDSELLETNADYIVNDCSSIRVRSEAAGLKVDVSPALERAQLTR
jgi:hypothetical protein